MRSILVVSALLLASCGSGSARIDNGRAIDGDTFIADEVHYRLTFNATEYPDAPELPGHCRPGRQCAPGAPFAARAFLQHLLDDNVDCDSYGTDRYGRSLVDCTDQKTGQDIGQQLVVNGYAQVCLKLSHRTECHS